MTPAADELAGTDWVTDTFGVRLRTADSPVGLDASALLRLALRRNPRRAHLLVSTVLGKHLPVDPLVVTAAGRLLGALVGCALDGTGVPPELAAAATAGLAAGRPAELLAALPEPRPRPVQVLGFCETATSLGHLVAQQLSAYYLHSTRIRVPGVPVAGTFEEGHSHATTHLLQPIDPQVLEQDVPLVLVDDEISTGRTIAATITALHALAHRGHYLVASLVDLRSAAQRAELDLLAAELGCRIEVVSLLSGSVELPEDLVQQVVSLLPAPPGEQPAPAAGSLTAVELPWPERLPLGGRHGVVEHQELIGAAAAAAARCRELVSGVGPRRVVVVGTEEFMYLPLLIAAELARDPLLEVRFQSTTRSPVHPVDRPGYPIRRRFTFTATDPGDAGIRYLYNADWSPADGCIADANLVLVLHEPMAGCGPHPVDISLTEAGIDVVSATFAPPGTRPLAGPKFGSYPATDVRWLLTDLSGHQLEGAVDDRERLIQSGKAHYAESLPTEYQPAPEYRELFESVLAESAPRLARAVGLVTELVLAERGQDVVLASLARAGTPVGLLMRRWAAFRHGLDLPHYAVSIVRGRGIDAVAMEYLAAHHDPASVVFVDGWTGKGAIARELTAALDELHREVGLRFNDELAVLADPGQCVRTFGTRDDFLIASACLNSTVSGLVSRTVLNRDLLAPHQFHGAKFYSEFAAEDVSMRLIDQVSAEFADVAADVAADLPGLRAGDRAVTFAGWAAIEKIREEFGISSVNFVKPGVGETTRVLLRRVPWRILLRENDNPDHRHLRLLAADRGVPIEIRPDLPYSCVGLIRQLSAADRGEG